MTKTNAFDVLVTCPPMLGQIDRFTEFGADRGIRLVPAKVTQTLSVQELLDLVPGFDGWMIGDDPATREVFTAAKAPVKRGIGVDNVDVAACKDRGPPIIHTPILVGTEAADVATAHAIAHARQLSVIDRGARADSWPKPAEITLPGRTVGVLGLGDTGRNTVRRLWALGLKVMAYDPGVEGGTGIPGLERAAWSAEVERLDFQVFACALSRHNFRMFDAALIAALQSGQVHSAALDGFEAETLPIDGRLRSMDRYIFGTHKGSNTVDAVLRASHEVIDRLAGFLETRPVVAQAV